MKIAGERWLVACRLCLFVFEDMMNIREIIDYGFDEAGHYNLSKCVNWEWNNRFTRRLGDARYNKIAKSGRIRLSSKLWPSMSEEERVDTVLHEVAHIVDMYNGNFSIRDSGGHGYTWRQICRKIGANPKRYASKDVADFAKFERKVARYRVKCGCSHGHIITKTKLNKIHKGYRYRCCACGNLLDINGIKQV